MAKMTNKCTSAAMQNDYLEVMASHIVQKICSDVAMNGFYTIMVDECAYMSNKEQYMVCLSWVNENFVYHEVL